MKDYRDLKVWMRSHALALEVYRATVVFPKEELCGLTSQIRRAASSVPTNIAEGCGREGDAASKRFINIALGSACELDYLILLATELKYFEAACAKKLASEALELRRMLGALVQKLKA
jgi:four helix bundle protein